MSGPSRLAKRRGDSGASDQAPLGEVLEFMQLIWAVAHGLERHSKVMRTARGLTGPQRLVLRVTGRRPGISAGELADTLRLHPSTLTGVLGRLEARRLLERTVDPVDGRRSLFRLTRAGNAFNVRSPGTVEDAVERVLARTSRSDVRAGERVLESLIAELDVAVDKLSKAPRRQRR